MYPMILDGFLVQRPMDNSCPPETLMKLVDRVFKAFILSGETLVIGEPSLTDSPYFFEYARNT